VEEISLSGEEGVRTGEEGVRTIALLVVSVLKKP